MPEDLERFDPATHKGRIFYEHMHRYALCREWVEGLRVLDVACGTGYGTAVLGTAAASVTGLDISQESVIEARRRYGKENVQYVVGDCYALPFDDDSFDVVVANEMIEHVEDHDGLINEIKRVLRPSGQFLVSTPNKPVYNRYKPPNIFHISEMDINGFESLLRSHFPHVRLIATRMMLSSVSFDLERRGSGDNQASARIYSAQNSGNRAIRIENEPLDLNDPEYILAVCSLELLDEQFPKTSLFFSSDDDLWLEHERIMAWASGLHDEDEVLRADLYAAQTQAQEHSAQLAEAEAAHAAAEAGLQQAQQRIADVLAEREQLLEQAKRDVNKDWAALARYIELLVEADVGAEVPELLKGLYALNERHQRMLGELSAMRERIDAQDRTDDVALAASWEAELQDQQRKQQQQHEQAVRELEGRISEADAMRVAAEARLQQAQQRVADVLAEREQLLAQTRRDADKDWAALARYIELLVEADVGAEVPELLKGLYALNERHQCMLSELSAMRERIDAQDRSDDVALAASRQADIQNQQRMQQHQEAVRELEVQIVQGERRHAAVSNELRVERSRMLAIEDRLNCVLVEHDRLKMSLGAAQMRERQLDEAIKETLRDAAQKEIQAKRAHALAIAELQTVQDKLEAATQAYKAGLATIQTKQEMLDAAQVRIERADNALQTLRVRHEEITGEHEATRRALDQTRSALASHAADLAPRLEKLRNKLAESFPKRRLLSAREERNRDEFRALHRNVRNELMQAAEEIKNKAIPASGTRLRRLAGVPMPGSLRTCIFSRGWIARNHPEIGSISLWSYLKNPQYWTIDPHPLFDAMRYREKRCDIDGREVSPLLHYIEQGWRESRDPHPWFCNDWYLYRNPDVLADGSMSPLEHYLLHGWQEGRKPSPLFDPVAYLDRYPDVRAAGMEPLTHFIVHGLPEGREVPIRGVTANSRLWLPQAQRNRPVLDFVLSCDVPEEEPQLDVDALLADFEELKADGRLGDLQNVHGIDVPDAKAPPRTATVAWPPRPLHDYWPPQGLRDFVLDRYDEVVLDRIWYLYSVMAAFENEADKFLASEACSLLVEHARSRAGSIKINTSGVPDVSIVIPVYNNILDTILCIVSVLDAETSHSFEIIVADDCSTDATATLVPTIGGCVRHVRHMKNQGFLGNCNIAAAHAQGRHILLLNNDTLVMPRWLDALLEPFDRFERVGLTGAKLINWDGTLQEAGGIYWKDGSAWNFGRNQTPRAPQFCYLKDVDYVSGAAICIPLHVWREMDGFDPLFTPAYCEDSDLAFRLRAAGYRTLLTPEAEVIHHEGRSHGRDVESGIKAYQVTNTQRLLERWRNVLERDHYPNAVNVLRARDRSFNKKHILVVDHYVPQWDQDAGSRSTFNCVEAFIALGYSVTLWPDNLWRDPDYTPVYQAMGVEVIYGAEFQNGFTDFIRERADLYDAAFINRPHIAEPYIDALREHTNTRVIFYGHDLHFKRLTRAMEIGEDVTLQSIEAVRQQELRICGKADIVLYPDQEEVDYVSRAVEGQRTFLALPVVVFPTNSIGCSARRVDRQAMPDNTMKLLFVGGFNHMPNRDGIIWFVNEVLPILKLEVGTVQLTIVGSKPPQEVIALEDAGVTVTGFVTDAELERFYEDATLAIAPLRYGAGVKGKVIEALAKGVPLVTTPVGAQGLVDPDKILFQASSAAEFAACIVSALTDRDQAAQRAAAGVDYIRHHYSFEALQVMLRAIVES